MADTAIITPIITGHDDRKNVIPMAYECKFTIESRGGVGGDYQHNVGGMQGEKRITFDGYASIELYDALIEAIAKVVE